MALAGGSWPYKCVLCGQNFSGEQPLADHLVSKIHKRNLKRITRNLLRWVIVRACGQSELAGLRLALDRRGRVLPPPAWQSIRLFLESPRELLLTYLQEKQF